MYADINEDNLDLDGYVRDSDLEQTKEELIQIIETARPPLATAYEAGIVKSAEETITVPMEFTTDTPVNGRYGVACTNTGIIIEPGTYRLICPREGIG
jgi:hypothetical protein